MAEITDKDTEDKRLANLKPAWVEGQSGNPKGRPIGQRNYKTIYIEALTKLAELNNKTPEEFENEILAKGLLSARSGDYRFYKDVHDRLHGTPTQKSDITVKASTGENSADVDLDKLAEEVAAKLKQKKLE